MKFPKPFSLSIILWLCCFGSAATLLGFLHGLVPMFALGRWLLVPTMIILFGGWAWSKKKNYVELNKALSAGFWGGIWGTLGYDLIRIPLHYVGFNPFPPIRSYGMYLLDAPASLFSSDLAGVLYHFSNGITFGWMFTLLLRRRSLWWAVLWGLVLETIAFLSAFGPVYGLRTAYKVLAIAYFAHLYYGWPLGAAANRIDQLGPWLDTQKGRWVRAVSLVLLFGVGFFLCSAWEKPWARNKVPPAQILLGAQVNEPGWTRVDMGQALVVNNGTDKPLTFQVRKVTDLLTLAPGEQREIHFAKPGLYQVITPEGGARSVMVSVEQNGFPLVQKNSRQLGTE